MIRVTPNRDITSLSIAGLEVGSLPSNRSTKCPCVTPPRDSCEPHMCDPPRTRYSANEKVRHTGKKFGKKDIQMEYIATNAKSEIENS